jgi:microcystin-dependent protein
MSQPFLGEIKLFALNYAPSGYAFCDGRSLPITQYSTLFSVIGSKFGGDGKVNFALPNFQGRLGVGQGQGPGLQSWVVGQARGGEGVMLTPEQMPAHSHGFAVTGATATSNDPRGAQLGRAFKGTIQAPTIGRVYSNGTADAWLASDSVAPAGGGQQHPNMMPFLTLNHCIAIRGRFPARD